MASLINYETKLYLVYVETYLQIQSPDSGADDQNVTNDHFRTASSSICEGGLHIKDRIVKTLRVIFFANSWLHIQANARQWRWLV